MSSQISQIHMRKRLREPRSTTRVVLSMVAGTLAIGTAAAWLFSSVRERPLDSRTRARLAPRPVPSQVVRADPTSVHVG